MPGGPGFNTGTAKKGILTGIGTLLGGPIGGLLGSLGSSLLGNRGAKSRQQLADRQNIKFWEMQNAYNTPKAQMGRLKDAGLNPNLIYGSNANTGVAGSVSPSKASPYNVQNPVPSAVQTALMGAQINNLNSVTEKNRAETARTVGMTPYQIDTSLSKANQARQAAVQSKIETSIYSKTEKDKIDKIVQEALLAKERVKSEKAKADFTKKMLDMNINPNSGFGSQMIQLIFGTTDDALKYLKDSNNFPNFK
jgi:hypothetical protein